MNKLKHLAIIVAVICIPLSASAFPADFDGDGKNDLVVWRPTGPDQGKWFVYPSNGSCPLCFTSHGTTGGCVTQWGLAGDVPISGDYDGDGKADPTVWRKSTQTWHVLFSSYCGGVSVQIGQLNDVPDEIDFNTDGKSDIVLYRPGAGNIWLARSSIAPYNVSQLNAQSPPNGAQDPVRAISGNVHPGNGTVPDFTKYTPFLQSGQNYGQWRAVADGLGTVGGLIALSGGTPSDIVPVQGNVGGTAVNRDDFITWKRSTGTWTIRYNGASPADQNVQWGLSSDIPLAGDFDNDGLDDLTVWRNAWVGSYTGAWFVKTSTGTCPAGFLSPISGGCYRAWGLPGDIPVQ